MYRSITTLGRRDARGRPARWARPCDWCLDAFVGWVKTRRPIEWLLRVLEYLPMSTSAHEDLRSYVFPKTDGLAVPVRALGIRTPDLEVEVGREADPRQIRQ